MSRAAALHLDGVFALVVYGLIITVLAVTFAASYLRPSRPTRSTPGGTTMVPSRTRLYTGVGLLTLAAIVGAVGWYKISGEPALNRQVPLLASAGMAVVLLSVAGGALLVADQLRGDDRRLDDLETAVTQLAAALAPSIESPPRLRGTTAAAGTPSTRAAAVVKPSPGAQEQARVASAQVTPEPAPVPPSAPAALKAAEPAKAAAKAIEPAKAAAVKSAPAVASTAAAKKPAKVAEPVKDAEPAKATAAGETAPDVTSTAAAKPAEKAAAKKAPASKSSTTKPAAKKAPAKKAPAQKAPAKKAPAKKAPAKKAPAKKAPAKKATASAGLFRPAGTTRQVVRPAPAPATEPAADVAGEVPAGDQAGTAAPS